MLQDVLYGILEKMSLSLNYGILFYIISIFVIFLVQLNFILFFSDGQARTKWKAAVWHPTVATQLCLASEDDLNPVVQLWDLRCYILYIYFNYFI